MSKNDSKTAIELINLIRDMISTELDKRDNTCVCQIVARNLDETFNIIVVPDERTVINRVKSISPDVLKEGDYVYVYKFQNRLNNAIIIAKVGNDNVDLRFVTTDEYAALVPPGTAGGGGGGGGGGTVAWGDVTGKPDFKTVSWTANYNDLINKPVIPSAQVNSDWNATTGVAQILNKPPIEKGSTTGSLQQVFDGSSFTFVNPNSPLNNETVNIGIATGTYATMLGGKGRVEGKRGFVNGTQVVATGNYSHAEGNNTHAAGVNSHAEGIQTYAEGPASHAEGSSTAASQTAAHAEGYETNASGVYAHAEGLESIASGDGAHAEGMSTHAIGNYSHAEGAATYANGLYSHAAGQDSTANGTASFASGYHVTANRDYQTVLGKYNLGQSPNTLLEIGNGTAENARSNAFEVYNSSGGIWSLGPIATDSAQLKHGNYTNTLPNYTGTLSVVAANPSGATTVLDSLSINGVKYKINTDLNLENGTGSYSLKQKTASGYENTASGTNSFAIGAENIASNVESFAQGYGTQARGNYSHSEGAWNIAHADISHTEGEGNVVGDLTEGDIPGRITGHGGHAEGYANLVLGSHAHAEGSSNLAKGDYSHVEGIGANVWANPASSEYAIKKYDDVNYIQCNTYGGGLYSGGGKTIILNTFSNGTQSYTDFRSRLSSGATIAIVHSSGTVEEFEVYDLVSDSIRVTGTITWATGDTWLRAELKVNMQDVTSGSALGIASHVGGFHNYAVQDYQTVIGKYNSNKSTTLFEVGNGTSNSSRSNAFEVHANGNVVVNNGTITIGNTTLTENQLQKLLALLDTLEAKDI